MRADDEVMVTCGKDRGKTGRVLEVEPGSACSSRGSTSSSATSARGRAPPPPAA